MRLLAEGFKLGGSAKTVKLSRPGAIARAGRLLMVAASGAVKGLMGAFLVKTTLKVYLPSLVDQAVADC